MRGGFSFALESPLAVSDKYFKKITGKKGTFVGVRIEGQEGSIAFPQVFLARYTNSKGEVKDIEISQGSYNKLFNKMHQQADQ